MPVVTAAAEHREMLQRQPAYATISDLADSARAIYVGLSDINWGGPLQSDGFVEEAEMGFLIESGAVGRDRRLALRPRRQDPVQLLHRAARPASASTTCRATSRWSAVAYGARKVPAIRAALKGRLITGLITDEQTAMHVLSELRAARPDGTRHGQSHSAPYEHTCDRGHARFSAALTFESQMLPARTKRRTSISSGAISRLTSQRPAGNMPTCRADAHSS